ncbi:fibrillarin [Streptomyces sp. WZ.A104]|uniref:TPM domain-containing protein n=1 Tax=Streptomyces sp. WZ.A104 TaxID=2023771 RepID=UPI000BBC87ED|nr:TPM domain-containing protein [Streptomyces sp. WZ.A104]PCG85629.1 fibrillarin [Streptomyces sp. WZ.A104]
MSSVRSRPRPAAPGRALLTGLLATLAAVCWLALPAGDARADDPVELSRDGQITDRVGALRDRTAQVEDALDRLYAEQRIQLFVVYVRDFSGRSAQTWSNETADRNGLGQDDVLLSVATHDRQYAYSVDADSRLTDGQLREVAGTAVEPALRENDWAGAAIGAANGFVAVLGGRPVTAPTVTPGPADPGTGGSSTSAGDLILPVAVVGGAGAVALYAYTRRKRRTTTRTTPAATGWGRGGEAGGAPEPPTPLPELDERAKEVLVDTDDAVRTSEEELGFATAQFGEEAAKPFTEAVARAKDELTQSFRLRQQLDDAFPEDDATRRRMLKEILTRCAAANERLDTVSADFDRLRALERTAPQALAAVDATYRELAGRVSAAETGVGGLRERYGEGAAAPAAADIEQAEDRLVFATSAVDQARTAVDAGENSRAAVYIRAAEGAVGQAGTLLDSVDRRAAELGEAAGKLPAALTETDTDLADAGGLLEGTAGGASTAGLRGRIARAEAVLADVRGAMAAGPYDPVDALRRVEEADAALDEALAGAREQERGEAKARTLLDQAMLTARSAIGAAADYVTTNRGAVGSQARTRLAEAQRRWERARELASTDVRSALTEARQADALAGQALSLAEQDVRGFGGRLGPGAVRGGGGGMGGAVLGGIILGGLFGGGGRGGGMGGGPGSFGGGGTRGRRGGGGRF